MKFLDLHFLSNKEVTLSVPKEEYNLTHGSFFFKVGDHLVSLVTYFGRSYDYESEGWFFDPKGYYVDSTLENIEWHPSVRAVVKFGAGNLISFLDPATNKEVFAINNDCFPTVDYDYFIEQDSGWFS